MINWGFFGSGTSLLWTIGESAGEGLWLLALVTGVSWYVKCDMWHETGDILRMISCLYALASLVLMIKTHWLTHSQKIDSPSDSSDPSDLITHNGMSLKMECHSQWNVTHNGMSLKMEFHWKWTFTENGMLPEMKCHSIWNVIQNVMSLTMECHSKLNVTNNGTSLKMELH